ncbi:MAG: hypothetical protein ACTHJT_12715 [Cytophaga sp.]|uniref:hypothetical protein n=1 Tax=Cytophaga sp. TaxID=29535 RepID=UPI003F8069B8
MKEYLTETAKWGKFLSIVGFVGLGLLVILAFSIGLIFEQLGTAAVDQFGDFNPGVAVTIFYLLFALLWFFPVFYMFKFSTGILKTVPAMDITGIENALSNLKSLFKFYGIFTIVILCFYGILFLVAMIAVLNAA